MNGQLIDSTNRHARTRPTSAFIQPKRHNNVHPTGRQPDPNHSTFDRSTRRRRRRRRNPKPVASKRETVAPLHVILPAIPLETGTASFPQFLSNFITLAPNTHTPTPPPNFPSDNTILRGSRAKMYPKSNFKCKGV